LVAAGIAAAVFLVLAVVGTLRYLNDPTPPVISVFRAEPESIPPGGSSTLRWQATGEEVRLTPPVREGALPTDAAITVSPSTTTKYTLSVRNGNQTVENQQVVIVAPPPRTPPSAASGSASSTNLTRSGSRGQALLVIDGLAPEFVSQGYSEAFNTQVVKLNDGQNTSYSLPLKAGTEYVLAAGGDKDAADIDLELKDPSGKVVARDAKLNATPRVSTTPSADGDYTLQLKMGRCGVPPCWAAVTGFGRSAGRSR
jgi:hypothetical protein